MRSTFRLLFYINRQKQKANGCCPIMGRITIDGKAANYSSGLTINPNEWKVDRGRAKNDKDINRKLDDLERKTKAVYKNHLDTNGIVSAEIIKNVITGKTKTNETLLSLFDEHNAESEKRAGIDLARQSYVRQRTTRKHIDEFLKYKYDWEDIALRTIEMQFIVDFEFYLSTVLELKPNTYNSYVNVLRMIVRLAVKQKILHRDPFAGYRIEKPQKRYRHLTTEQFQKLIKTDIADEKLRCTRDMFLFSCFTGLGQGDLSKLTDEHIVTDNKGEKWLNIERSKTGVESVVKLLDIPRRKMERYPNGFMVPNPQLLAAQLRTIAEKAQLDIHLTFYMARHTFATTVTLDNGVPIETISKMLGHTSIRTTQVYAEITNQKVAKDFERLSQIANNKYKIST